MPSHSARADTTGDAAAVPAAVHTAARRYWRRTLTLRGLFALGYFVAALAVLFTRPLLPAIAVIGVLLGTFATPVFKSGGSIELTTDRPPAVVRDDFTDGIPPVLGFQAALADDIRATDAGAEYDFTSALGLRSATMGVETDRLAADVDADLELVVTVGGDPWSRYRVTTSERDGTTAVTITILPDRRFGIRRLPDFVFGRRYRDRLFDGQGYTLVADDTSLSV